MNKLTAIFMLGSCIFTLAVIPQAIAWPVHGKSPYSCAMGAATNVDNGCVALANTTLGGVQIQYGLVKHTNFFSGYANASGQTYVTRPPFNVAGADYGVGAWTPKDAMTDPSAINPGTGNTAIQDATSGVCIYHTSGTPVGNPATTYPYVECGSSAIGQHVTITGFDFGRVSGQCVPVYVTSAFHGDLYVINNYWLNGWGCTQYADTPGTSNGGYMLRVNNWNAYANVYFWSNTLDGDYDGGADDYSYQKQGLTNAVLISTAGKNDMRYNAFIKMPTRPVSRFGNTQGTDGTDPVIASYNYFEGFVNRGFQGHGEAFIDGNHTLTTPFSLLIEGNTILEPASWCPTCQTGDGAYATGTQNGDMQDATIRRNVGITNNLNAVPSPSGGASTGTITGFIDDGYGNGTYSGVAGNILTITAPPPAPYRMSSPTQLTGVGVSATYFVGDFGSYSQWRVYLDNKAGGTYLPSLAIPSRSFQLGQINFNSAAFYLGGSKWHGSVVLDSNYADKTGSSYYFSAGGGSVCDTPVSIIPNTNMSLTTGSYINALDENNSTGKSC